MLGKCRDRNAHLPKLCAQARVALFDVNVGLAADTEFRVLEASFRNITSVRQMLPRPFGRREAVCQAPEKPLEVTSAASAFNRATTAAVTSANLLAASSRSLGRSYSPQFEPAGAEADPGLGSHPSMLKYGVRTRKSG